MPDVWLTRAGLICDIVGVLLIALDLFGSRLEPVERATREYARQFRPKRFLRFLDHGPDGKLDASDKVTYALWMALLLGIAIWGNRLWGEDPLEAAIARSREVVPPHVAALGFLGFVVLFFGGLVGGLAFGLEPPPRDERVARRLARYAGTGAFFLVFGPLLLMTFLIGLVPYAISLLVVLAMSPLRLSHHVKEKYGARSALALLGVPIVLLGFSLQFLGTF